MIIVKGHEGFLSGMIGHHNKYPGDIKAGKTFQLIQKKDIIPCWLKVWPEYGRPGGAAARHENTKRSIINN
jgi:hypothetical protein